MAAHIPRPRTANALRSSSQQRTSGRNESPLRRVLHSRNSSHTDIARLMPGDLAPPSAGTFEKPPRLDGSSDQDSFDTDASDAELRKTLLDDPLRSTTDVEKQFYIPPYRKRPGPVASEYEVPTRTKMTYLGFYFALNLGLTIYNKAVLGEFDFPWLLTTVHTSCAALGCYLLLLRGTFRLSRLTLRENMVLVAFSLLFTINIAISNVSLAAVSVPFHQILRSTVPIFTVAIYRIYFKRVYSYATYVSLVPLVLGVALATYGDYYFTTTGFILTLLGTVLASVKTVVTNRFMTGSLALPALEVLLRMSPLAALQSMLYASATGEAGRFVEFVRRGELPRSLVLALLGNGFLAFVLNVSSFQTNKLAGALTLTVSGNLKQCLTILLGILLFDVKVSPTNGLGMFITIIGAGIYSKVELDSKGKKPVQDAVVTQKPRQDHNSSSDGR